MDKPDQSTEQSRILFNETPRVVVISDNETGLLTFHIGGVEFRQDPVDKSTFRRFIGGVRQ